MLPFAKKDSIPTTQKGLVIHEFPWQSEAQYVGPTMQWLADRIKQHVPTSIRMKSTTIRKHPPFMCKKNNSQINCELVIGHFPTNPECAKIYIDNNFWIIGQARLSFV